VIKLRYDVYLAGAITGENSRAVILQRQEAKKLCQKYGLTYYDPAEHEHVGCKKTVDTRPTPQRIRWYVPRDNKAVDQSRSLLNLTGHIPSIGVGWEMGRMKHRNKRPVVAVMPLDKANFTLVEATKICATQLAAFRYLKRRIK
jgi:hypothetical protein